MQGPSSRRPFRLRADFSGDELGVSEVLGNVILIAMTVTMLGAFGATVMSTVSTDAPAPPAATFTIGPSPGDTFVDVRLLSGSTLDLEATSLILQANGTDVANGFYVKDGASAANWAPGETLRVNISGAPLASTARLMLMVIDERSHKPAGTAYATVPGPATGAPIARNTLLASLAFDRTSLTADGATHTNATVTVQSSLGILLVERVALDLSTLGGPGALVLADDGASPDRDANDGIFTARFAVGNFTFASMPGEADRLVRASVRDIFGNTANASADLRLTSPSASKVGPGTTFRNIGSSAIIGTGGELVLANFTFRDVNALDNDQIEVRVSDLNDASNAWSALVSFANGGCSGPSVTSVVLRRDGLAGNLTYTPATGCFLVGNTARLNLASIPASRDASGTIPTWSSSGSTSTFQYGATGIAESNEALIAYFGDAVSPSPFLTGLGQTDLSWAPPRPPGAPSPVDDLTASGGDQSADLAWSEPFANGGAITGYQILRNGIVIDTIGTNTSYRDEGLTNGVAYEFSVRAVNAAGTAATSNIATATPLTLPGQPRAFSAEPAIRRAYLNWTAPASDGGSAITAYHLYLNGSFHAATNGANTSFIALGLEHNASYDWEVAAVSSVSEGPKTDAVELTTPGLPQAPALLQAATGDRQVTLSWLDALPNGRAVSAYNIYRNGVILDVIATNTSYLSAGLTNGVLYVYSVSAMNEVGEGVRSNAVNATPATLPGIPTGLTAQTAVARAYLNWSAPGSNGGSAITGYKVYLNDSLHATIGANTSFLALSLQNNATYHWSISALNANGEGERTSVASAATPGVPSAPTGLSAGVASGQIALTWNTATANGRPVTAHQIYVNGTLRSTIGANTSYVVAGLVNGVSYSFSVSAQNEVGAGPKSLLVNATPAAATTVPGAPTAFGGTLANRSVSLTWSAPATNGGAAVTAYRIYRNGTLLQQIGTNTTYTAANLQNNVSYAFEVSAVNSVGEGAKAGPLSIMPGAIPYPPSALVATAGNTSATLTWSRPIADGGRALLSYSIYRGTSAGSKTLLATTADGAATSFVVTGLANGTTYFFHVTANNAIGSSAASNDGSALPRGAPFPPTGLSAVAGNTSVALAWTAPADAGGSSLTGYGIYRGTSTTSLALVATIGTNTTFTVNSLTNGTSYVFAVSAINAQGASAMSSSAGASPRGAPLPPLMLVATPGNMSVALTWSAPTSDGGSPITGYTIHRGPTSATLGPIATIGANTSFNANSLANGTSYVFAVSALNAQGASSTSTPATAIPRGAPYPPSGLVAVASNASVALSWSLPIGDGGSPLTGFGIDDAATGTRLATTTNGANTSFTVNGLANGAAASYRVVALNAVGASSASNSASATPATVPNPPADLLAVAGIQRTTLTWTAGSTGGSPLTGYAIYAGTTPGSGTLVATTTSGANTSFVANTLTPERTYYFTVRAMNAVGASNPSNEPSAVPLGHTYVSTATTALNGGTFTSIANLARNNSGDVATLTEALSTLTALTPSSANDRYFNGSTSSWTATSILRSHSLSQVASGGDPGGFLRVEQTAGGDGEVYVDHTFTVSTAANGPGSVSFDWLMENAPSPRRAFTVLLVKPDATTLTLLPTVTAWTANVWNAQTAIAIPQSALAQTGTYVLRFDVSTSGNADRAGFDDVHLSYPAPTGPQRFGQQMQIPSVSAGTSYVLEIRYRSLTNPENLVLHIEGNTGFAIRGNLTSTSMTTLQVPLLAENMRSGNSVNIRLIDAITGSDAASSTWEIDLIRVVTYP